MYLSDGSVAEDVIFYFSLEWGFDFYSFIMLS